MDYAWGMRAAWEAALTPIRRGTPERKGELRSGRTGAEIARADAGDDSELGTYRPGAVKHE